MIDKLNIVKNRFDEINDLIIQPDIISDQKRYVQLTKEYKDLKNLMDKREIYIELTANLEEAQEIISRNDRYGQNAIGRSRKGRAKAGRKD